MHFCLWFPFLPSYRFSANGCFFRSAVRCVWSRIKPSQPSRGKHHDLSSHSVKFHASTALLTVFLPKWSRVSHLRSVSLSSLPLSHYYPPPLSRHPEYPMHRPHLCAETKIAQNRLKNTSSLRTPKILGLLVAITSNLCIVEWDITILNVSKCVNCSWSKPYTTSRK